MKALFRILKWVKPYRGLFVGNILSNILTAVFTALSIPILIPFIQLLFGNDPVSSNLMPPGEEILGFWAYSDFRDGIAVQNGQVEPNIFKLSGDYFQYRLESVINRDGREQGGLIVIYLIVGIFFLKNVFRYLALVFLAPMRNGIVRDIRQSVYEKTISLPLVRAGGQQGRLELPTEQGKQTKQKIL